jgi:protein-tyrosine phosphatase
MRLASLVNFRDVGGHPTLDGRRVRRGVVYRSAHLGGISSADMAALERAGIRTVIDFRTSIDLEEDGQPVVPRGARHVRLPMGNPARMPADLRDTLGRAAPAELERRLGAGGAEQMMIQLAEALVLEQRAGFGEMLRQLAVADAVPAIMHCSAGKDRTGWAASLLLLIARVPDAAIVDHYVESNRHRVEANAAALARVREGVDPEWIRPFLECRPVYARASLDAMREAWGDVDRYVTEGLGVSRPDLAALRERLVG